ncbi:MAG: hypothetical protein JRJ01_14600 [Deltaproteobacteria bacterium]|nr:hypothetical protein [Deltaproteobacteria bacterium]
MMRYYLLVIGLVCLAVIAGFLIRNSQQGPQEKKESNQEIVLHEGVGEKQAGQATATGMEPFPAAKEWKYPIAPGVWYPGDGAIPDKPMRYYRIRCWPGCHSGSPHGLYPDRDLGMKPIFPTSTVPGKASP